MSNINKICFFLFIYMYYCSMLKYQRRYVAIEYVVKLLSIFSFIGPGSLIQKFLS